MEVSSAEIEEAGQLNINSLSPTVPSCGNVESAMTVNNDGGDQTAAAVTANNDNNQMSVDDVKYLGLISQQEYEAQFFGFTPKSFSDGLYNATVEYLHDGLLSVAQKLSEAQFGEQSEQQLVDAAESAFQRALPSIGKKFDKLEIYLSQNIFNVPPHIILDEDASRKEHPAARAASLKQCEDEIHELTEKISELEQVKESFRQELAETEPLVAQLHDVIDQQRSLLSIRDTQSKAHDAELMLNQHQDIDKL